MTTTKKKPPTQTAGVAGIAAIPIVITPEQKEQTIDWAKLCELPTFQMFAIEREPSLNGAFEYVRGENDSVALWEKCEPLNAWLTSHEPEDLYKQYCAWHAAKGHWPNETPMGDIIDKVYLA